MKIKGISTTTAVVFIGTIAIINDKLQQVDPDLHAKICTQPRERLCEEYIGYKEPFSTPRIEPLLSLKTHTTDVSTSSFQGVAETAVIPIRAFMPRLTTT